MSYHFAKSFNKIWGLAPPNKNQTPKGHLFMSVTLCYWITHERMISNEPTDKSREKWPALGRLLLAIICMNF